MYNNFENSVLENKFVVPIPKLGKLLQTKESDKLIC